MAVDAPVAAHDPAPPLTDLPARAAAGETLVCWDRPASPDEELAAPLHVGGWAYAASGIVEVWVVVDGTTWVQALHGRWRPDLVGALERGDADRGGYRVVLSPADCPPGTREITVIAIDGDGRAFSVTGTIRVCADRGEDARLPDGHDAEVPVPSRPLDGNGERFVPELHEDAMIAAEHHTRYRWACGLADGRTILDAGCGVGWGTVLLADAGAASVVGVDISPLALGSAEERAGDRATFVEGDLRALPFDDDSFDLITCFEAIEHVEDPERALDDLRRVLRPNGILLLSSPNRGVYPDGNPHHLHEYTAAELEASLGARFAHVAAYRQQTHVASLLTADESFAIDDAGVALDADVRKIVGGGPGDELYTVVAASDAPLAQLPGIAVLTSAVDVKSWLETLAKLERRALLAEADLSTANAELGMLGFQHDKALTRAQAAERGRLAAEAELEEIAPRLADAERRLADSERWLADHRSSLSWRITAPLRTAKQRAKKGR